MSARFLVILVSAIAIAAIAGCGGKASGGGDSDESSGEAVPRGALLSKAEFIEEAGKGCREAREGINQRITRFIAVQKPSKPDPVVNADLAHLVLLQVIEDELESIRELGVPGGEQSPIEVALDEGQYVIDRIVYEYRIPSIDSVYRKFAGVHKMFRDYGLPACVSSEGVTAGGAGESQ